MKLKRKLKNRSGFTLAETMLCVLILLLVSGIVATGMPAAKNAYDKVVLGSNAQVLLSTAANALRAELGTARGISIEDGGITYYSAETGGRSKIYLGTYTNPINSDKTGEKYTETTIMLQRYTQVSSTVDFAIGGKLTAGDAYPLVSKVASTADMYVTYTGSPSYNEGNGTVTFSNFRVCRKKDNTLLAGGSSLTIRVFPEIGE